MIDLYYWTTPNGHKITIFLEEAGLDYRIRPIDIGKGDQFAPEFLAISPNNRIPAIVDHAPPRGGAPQALFESGAILLYLAEKQRAGGQPAFLPDAASDPRAYYQALQWLMWQMGGFGPMLGQVHHFRFAAPAPVPYALERYAKETQRLYGVLDRRLAQEEYVGGDYSIADMAVYSWAASHERHTIDLADYPQVARWFAAIAARPAVQRAFARAADINPPK